MKADIRRLTRGEPNRTDYTLERCNLPHGKDAERATNRILDLGDLFNRGNKMFHVEQHARPGA